MAHTNSTTNYSLPQFLSTDKPAWLTDVNPAYSAIDTGMHNAQVSADAAQADATQALDDAAAAAGAATTADAKASGAVASLAESFDPTATYSVGEYVMYNNLLYICTDAIVTPGPWTGSTNWTRVSVDSIATTLQGNINTIDSKTGSSIRVSDDSNESIANVISNFSTWEYASLNPNSVYCSALGECYLWINRSSKVAFIHACLSINTAMVQNNAYFTDIGVRPTRTILNIGVFSDTVKTVNINTNGSLTANSAIAAGSRVELNLLIPIA